MSISRALEEGDEWKTRDLRQSHQFLSTSHQFLSTFHPGLKQVSRTIHLDAQNDHNQISRELVSVRDMAEDAEVGSGTSSTTRSAENSSASVDMAEDAEVGEGDGGDDETVERLALSKKSNVPTGYLTSLRSEKR